MKLILASDLSFLLKYGFDLAGIPKDQIKIGYVITATKRVRTHQDFFENVKKTLREDGYFLEDIDIEGKNKEELKNFFSDKNIVYVEGGNTFYLLKIVRETGFGEVVKELLEEGIVYIGVSAGAYLMCPTIEVSDWNDETVDRFGITDFTALNYVPFILKAHYKDKAEAEIKERAKTLKYPLRILKDGQGILVEDGTYRFIGDGEEVFL
ncbi:MAG: Type 1 glutamine amidotransferase-like domain-containing protein [Candidatus Pacebacteria bacterium]|nr:Type 1 glutamine amidotransferase-like domain-containing protein [Candidatus Paceibacterota bacterium]